MSRKKKKGSLCNLKILRIFFFLNERNLLRDALSKLTTLNLDTELTTESAHITRQFSFYHCDYPRRQACEPPFKSPVVVPSCSNHSPHTPYWLGGLCPFWASPSSCGSHPWGLAPGDTRAFKILCPGSSCSSSTYPVSLLPCSPRNPFPSSRFH